MDWKSAVVCFFFPGADFHSIPFLFLKAGPEAEKIIKMWPAFGRKRRKKNSRAVRKKTTN